MKLDKLGWVVAAGLFGAMAGMGFQGQTVKIGTADLEKIFNESEYAKTQTATLRSMGEARQGVLEFLRTYRVAKTEDVQKFRDLSVKAKPTPADRTEMDRIKADAIKADTTHRQLQTKQSPTAAEAQQLDELNRRAQQNSALFQQWAQAFNDEVSAEQMKLRNDTLQRVRDAVKQVASQQGFSVVMAEDVAPYSPNDLTAEALKAMNARK